MRWRSVLFVPGNRPDLAAKATRSSPDAVVIDLEDAVPAAAKADARPLAVEAVSALVGEGVAVVLRVNPPATEWFEADTALLPIDGLAAVIVPKFEFVEDLAAVTAAVVGAPVIAGLETVRGVVDARSLLTGPVGGCYFGAEDYIVDLGGRRTPGNAEVATARAMVAMAARLAGVPAFDMITADFGDHDRFRAEAGQAHDLGYAGKLCIHPAQVPLANAAFVPSDDEVDRATRLLAVYDEAVAAGRATVAFDGAMVDEVVARQARAVLAVRAATPPPS
ncbi:MAG TPA: CoA ester lyase [Acidimicrobiales bacterium]